MCVCVEGGGGVSNLVFYAQSTIAVISGVCVCVGGGGGVYRPFSVGKENWD